MLTIKGKSLAAVLLVAVLTAGGASLLIPGARADRQENAAPAGKTEPAESGAGHADHKARPVPLPTRPAQAAVGGEKRSVVEKQFRQYQVEITVARADPGGRDLGPHGKAKVLGEPRLLTVEGREATYQAGGEATVPGDEPGQVESLAFGTIVRVKVKRLGDGRLRLDAVLEQSQVEERARKGWRRRRSIVEATQRVKLGEEIKLEEKDSAGKTQHWALIRVVREEAIQSRTESREAVAATDKTTPAYVIGAPDVLLIEVADGLLKQPVGGPHLVRPDGTVGLGVYGSTHVAGLTLEQARAAIAGTISAHLGRGGKSPTEVARGLSVDVLAYNSRVFYVITDLAGRGEQVYRFPITGNETVLDAIAQVEGLALAAGKCRLWVARQAAAEGAPQLLLPVDWVAISQEGAMRTNYQLQPGDRLFIKADRK
jgi:protein involved in polysaccharide export with SLBB domain